MLQLVATDHSIRRATRDCSVSSLFRNFPQPAQRKIDIPNNLSLLIGDSVLHIGIVREKENTWTQQIQSFRIRRVLYQSNPTVGGKIIQR